MSADLTHVFVTGDDTTGAALLARARREANGAGGVLIEGRADPREPRPYAPFDELVDGTAAWIAAREPAVIQRFPMLLASLLPHWAPHPLVGGVTMLSAGLADYCLHGRNHGLQDFYQGRDLRSRVIDDIVRFLLDAANAGTNADAATSTAAGSTVTLWCTDLHHADPDALRAFRILAHYARGTRLLLRATVRAGAAGADELLRTLASAQEDVHVEHAAPLPFTPDLEDVQAGQAAVPPRAPMDRQMAIERTWAISAYDCAIHHAERYVSEGAPGLRVGVDLFLALLYAEAGRHRLATDRFMAALAAETTPARRAFVHRLIAYHYIFGPRDFERGLTHFRSALEYFTAQKQLRDIAWIQNSMAFALNQQGKSAEAMTLERDALRKARRLPRPDRFLFTILHLNLGRLHRPKSLRAAATFIHASMEDSDGELNLHLQLLFYVTLASLYRSKGYVREAIAYLQLCVTLFRDMGLVSSRRVLPLLSKGFAERIGAIDDAPILDSDRVALLLAFNFAEMYAEAGDRDRAALHRTWLRQRLDTLLGPAYAQRADALGARASGESATARASSAASASGASNGSSVSSAVRRRRAPIVNGTPHEPSLFDRYAPLVEWRDEPDVPGQIASALAAGRTVAWLCPDDPSIGGHGEGIVLCDVRALSTRARMLRDLGRTAPASGGLVMLPEGAAWFGGVDASLPGILQEGTLLRQHRAALAGAQPIRCRVQVVAEARQPRLHAALDRFHRQTGVPIAAIASFSMTGEPIATAWDRALKYFLESSLDVLVCGGAWVTKRHGSEAIENLSALKPRLCGVLATSRAQDGLVVTRGRMLRVGARGHEFLRRCDGETTIAQLMAGGDDAYEFVRQLRRQKVLYFTL